jgi:hypothetical protein
MSLPAPTNLRFMHINNNEIKALLQVTSNAVVDPDLADYPHLFVTRTYTDDEMGSFHEIPTTTVEPYICEERFYDDFYDKPQPSNFLPRNLKAYSGIHKVIPNSKLKSSGWKRPKKNADRITCVEPHQWVDTDSGEILEKLEARKRGAVMAASISLRMIEAMIIVYSCPDTKKSFQAYVLKLRNKRGGLIVDLETALDHWIQHYHPNIDSTDRSRKRKTLENFLYSRNILSDNQTFSKPLQFISPTTKTDNIRERARFVHVLPVRGKPGCGIGYH